MPPLTLCQSQFFEPKAPRSAEFTPGAYEHLVKILNVDGLYDDARRKRALGSL
jgi:hypothetical protein